MIRAGLPIWTFRVLTVPGRRTGRAIETPLAVFEQDGRRYLVASYGTVNWVLNLHKEAAAPGCRLPSVPPGEGA